MGSDWPVVTLSDVIEIKYGKDHKKLNEGLIPCYGSGGIMRYVSEYLYDKESILIPRKGSLNNIYYLEKPFWTVDTLFWSKINLSKVDPKFLYYQLKLTDFNRLNEGSAVPSLTVPILNNIKIKLPSIRVQKSISGILSCLDDKIELIQQTNETLEKMAQALFKSWFVDFDPVFDNAFDAGLSVDDFPDELQHRAMLRQQHRFEALQQGAEVMMPQTPQSTAVLQPQNQQATQTESERIRGLFPSEFEQCDDPSIGISGWIPKGWIKDTLDSVAKYSSSRLDGTELNIDNYISTENMLSNKMGITQASSIPLNIKTMPAFHQGHVLISNIRPYFQKIWMATSSGGRSNDVLGFEVLDKKTEAYLLNLLYQDSFFEYMMTTSTGSKMPRGDKKAIMDWKVVVSPIKTREVYSEMVKEFYQAISLRVKENQCLTHLRDTLLPKLISGELKFSEAVQSIETK
ncbi:MAG: restriction endonuclease subunit S [Shewanella sp.]|uniref:restriction endonuclease subunit S n=1 Tax=Shewanella sp. TaxID=50422 RepID=UPI0030023713